MAYYSSSNGCAIFQDLGQALGNVPDAPGDHDPELSEQSAY